MARDPAAELSPGVRQFIERCIDGIEQLEILLLLQRQASRYWDADAVAQSLCLSERQVADEFETLGRRGLLDVRIGSVVRYRFSPVTPALVLQAEQVARAYKEHRREVLALMSRRHQSLKDFSDAFKLTQDPKDG